MKRENFGEKKARTKRIIARLKKEYPQPKTALQFADPVELLIATILSAQCTDARVNLVTPGLFKKYPTVSHFAIAQQQELEQDIRSTGFYRNKAKNIIACCATLVEKFKGQVPKTVEELIQLPGVGRKTANCVMGGAYGINSGVVVDTHVMRLSQRMALTKESDPEKIERDLMELVPKKEWYDFSNVLILHGRAICDARKPKCTECVIRVQCPSAETFVARFWKESAG